MRAKSRQAKPSRCYKVPSAIVTRQGSRFVTWPTGYISDICPCSLASAAASAAAVAASAYDDLVVAAAAAADLAERKLAKAATATGPAGYLLI